MLDPATTRDRIAEALTDLDVVLEVGVLSDAQRQTILDATVLLWRALGRDGAHKEG